VESSNVLVVEAVSAEDLAEWKHAMASECVTLLVGLHQTTPNINLKKKGKLVIVRRELPSSYFPRKHARMFHLQLAQITRLSQFLLDHQVFHDLPLFIALILRFG